MHTDPAVDHLLKTTVQAHITPATTLSHYTKLPHDPSLSKINVQR